MTEKSSLQRLISILNENPSKPLPISLEATTTWAHTLLGTLFPEWRQASPIADSETALIAASQELASMLEALGIANHTETASDFFDTLEAIYQALLTDADAIWQADPATKDKREVVAIYPGFFALAFHRIAHSLRALEVPLLPRILSEYAHKETGIDIHPGATIASGCAIDHGTGIVIGETTIIGERVTIYQGVTLGALRVEKSAATTKRHPTVESNVTIYANATILGGDTVIGSGSVIGGNAWVTASVGAGSKVR